MRIYDIIAKKRDGFELSKEEIKFFVEGSVKGEIKDYQISALLMAIYLRGMNDRETADLTLEMAHSGDILDLSFLEGKSCDKHSTGGVGDKTTLIVAPIVASLGGKIAKMSGRGLGHTGGTIDKLESISGFKTALSPKEFTEKLSSHGIVLSGQTGNLAPADKIFYALRDSTATVSSIPLIASSIMSKKLASGADCIVLDVKYGSGAFMKTPEEAEILSNKMIDIGKRAGKKVSAVISNMDSPLGKNIGNALEVKEAVEVLKGKDISDLREVSLILSSVLVEMCFDIPRSEARKMCEDSLKSGLAFRKFKELIVSQGGSGEEIENPEKLPFALYSKDIISEEEGYIESMKSDGIGSACVVLGAGRNKKDDEIDFSAGITLLKKQGDKISKGERIAVLYSNKKDSLAESEKIFSSSIIFSKEKPKEEELIYKIM